MLHLDQVVVVEGRYDQIALSAVLDATILTTDGFRLFADKEKARLFSDLARTRGLIVLTDSDAAGFQIRNFIRSVTRDENVLHLYIPQVPGKERRKRLPSKEGFLGVEGFTPAALEQLFRAQGLGEENVPKRAAISRADFYRLGLSGKENSARRRREILARFGLPPYLSAKAMLEILPCYTDLAGLEKLCGEL